MDRGTWRTAVYGVAQSQTRLKRLSSSNDAKAETPILWPPHAKGRLIGKDSCWEGSGAGGEGDNRG